MWFKNIFIIFDIHNTQGPKYIDHFWFVVYNIEFKFIERQMICISNSIFFRFFQVFLFS